MIRHSPLIVALALSLHVLHAGSARAADHSWQFEDQPGFGADSIGAADLLVNTAVQATRPVAGRGSRFPGESAADFTDDASILAVDIAPLVDDFTIELYVHFDLLNGAFATQLFAQGICNGHANILADVRRDGLRGTILNEVRIASEDGAGGVSQLNTGFVPEVGVDYFVAVVHDDSQNTLVFYWKDLTNGGAMQSATLQGFVSYESALSRFEVGDLDSDSCGTADFGHDGLIDDVRVSYFARGEWELLEPVPAVPSGSLGPWILLTTLVLAVGAARLAPRAPGDR